MPTIQPREITESFHLERVLKSSRSAIVFRASDPATGATVAIKLIPPASLATLQACQERFMVAMAVLASAAPATFPALLDHGFTPDDSAFMVMEFVEGERLDALIGAAPARILGLALEVSQGLDALARAGASHGNLSPENIVSHRRAGVEHVSILGFGTAAFHAGARAAGETAPPSGAGRFVAPERRGAATAADWRADLYALAATCCALLRAEVAGDDVPTVTLPQAVAQRIPEPAALAAALGQALRADPAARPASFEAFRQAIVTSLAGTGPRTAPAVAVPPATPHGDAGIAEAQPEPPAAGPEPKGARDVGEDTAPARVVPIILGPAPAPLPPAAAETPARERLADEARTGPVPVQRLPEPPTAPDAGGLVAVEPPGATEPPQLPESATPVPATAAVPEEHPEPGRQPGPSVPASALRTTRHPAAPWAAVAAAVVVVAAAVGTAWYASTRPGRTVRIAIPTAAPRRPTPIPSPAAARSAAVQLQMAEAAMALGDLPGALARLDAISPAELAGLTPAEQERFKELRAAYLAKRQHAVMGEVQAALAAGNMTALAGILRGLSRTEEASFPRDRDFIATLEDARRALDLHAALLKAQRQGELGEVVRDAGVLLGLAPRCAQATQMRSQAAAALERDADTFAAAGKYEAALAGLATLQDAWNDRPGLADRIERLRGEQAAEQRFAAAMAQVEQSERDRAPENGLALLRAMPADPKTRARVEQARERLAKQLEQLDAAPPSVALAQGIKLEYRKGAPATIALRIRDDHRVQGARFFARVEGAPEFVELPMRRGAGEDWSVEISPEFHHNQTVEFYVTASDYSGHTAQLGSAQDPLKLKRKRNWLGF